MYSIVQKMWLSMNDILEFLKMSYSFCAIKKLHVQDLASVSNPYVCM